MLSDGTHDTKGRFRVARCHCFVPFREVTDGVVRKVGMAPPGGLLADTHSE
jgi:hypothetical protein